MEEDDIEQLRQSLFDPEGLAQRAAELAAMQTQELWGYIAALLEKLLKEGVTVYSSPEVPLTVEIENSRMHPVPIVAAGNDALSRPLNVEVTNIGAIPVRVNNSYDDPVQVRQVR